MIRSMAPAIALGAALAAACGTEPAAPAGGPAELASVNHLADVWSPATRLEDYPPAHADFNTTSLDGCPFIARDGLSFYMASNRPGGEGGIDIWISTRAGTSDPWGAPVNLGPPINSPQNDFCPTIARDDHTFYFVSNRPGGCGGTDIYVTRRRVGLEFDPVTNLGCAVNSAADEASPFPLPLATTGEVLYFSSFRAGGYSAEPPEAVIGDADIYMSESHGGSFGPAALVSGVNSGFDDAQPNVRRDGLELFFYSTRPDLGGLGAADLYASTRSSSAAGWSTPVNLGSNVNSVAAETRPSLSWDGTTLYFGSTRSGVEGVSDIFQTTRFPD